MTLVRGFCYECNIPEKFVYLIPFFGKHSEYAGEYLRLTGKKKHLPGGRCHENNY
jgi:hypothetical protein